ncbi:hypothetical protein BJD60_gp46 [Gordonia phage Schnabeltier]|uniref:Uncharacterized protein n=1 Tax=Gordonia phage Schnabeltier TaxID=1821561 RepID=A0A142KA34_9CAUD|nr:hypothetical protein BJD60_gp46 [Gordonia phage Schnabeltier]AMS02967.1 hypothetical protein SEA_SCHNABELTIER_46 [Gordonia phage Schnabeltier]
MSIIHSAPHELAGQQVPAVLRTVEGPKPVTAAVDDYWDRKAQTSWKTATDSRHALTYALRAGLSGLPLDDEVLLCVVGSGSQLVHVSELVPARDCLAAT